jgi:hypothetical protein
MDMHIGYETVAPYPLKVVDLLLRVTTVSVETQKIVEAMKGAER